MLLGTPSVVQGRLARTIRSSGAEVYVERDHENQLDAASTAHCQHVRSVCVERPIPTKSAVAPALLAEIHKVLGLLTDL